MSRQALYTILAFESDGRRAFFLREAVARAKLSWELRFVANGEEVLQYVEGRSPFDNPAIFPRPSLVLINLDMPLLNGFEVLRLLRADSQASQLPVIVLASSVLEAGKTYAEELGAKGFFAKPETAEEAIKLFRELSKRWLDSRSRREKQLTF
jgi:CheY-like chemotaxis protein